MLTLLLRERRTQLTTEARNHYQVVITTLRGAQELSDQLHAEHRRTYAEHGLSFNAWLLHILAARLAESRK